ncbi:MAG: DegT/DnrJ/EryC1/StrS family aminotransferase [Coriobacteriia bacterium]|nr:DegT/DnrJ/EryC1/StrS family aminotransferase [Coriobacteriia bacterium]
MPQAVEKQRTISFSPPDITEAEIQEVAEALRSGWITTGPRTKELEKRLKAFTGADGFACFASATHAAEMCLRILGIGPGDEVIVPAYTYTASASVVCHVGAKLVLVDTLPGSFEPDYDAIAAAITERTKAVIPVDLFGRMVDYDRLFAAVESKRDLWHPETDWQRCFDRVIVVADAAHALGATYKGKPAGTVADFTSFSFHAVKNFTTAEGGGLAWREGIDSNAFYHECMLWSLHGQNKDALSKSKAGAWEYDIVFPGYKCNMTDMAAALGLVQLDRYPGMLERRRQMIERYQRNLADAPVELFEHYTADSASSGHLMITRVVDALPVLRNAIIERMAESGVSANVHYKPLPLLTAYRELGFSIQDFPNAYTQFANEITLPLHTQLTDDDIDYVCDVYKQAIEDVLLGRGFGGEDDLDAMFAAMAGMF